jgi:hypothetical protein
MKYFAVLDENNIVTDAHVVEEDAEYVIQENIISYSMDNSITNNPAAIGYTYNADLNAFIPPQLDDTYILNTQTFEWEPNPELEYDLHGDGILYKYDPDLKGWILCT